MIVKAVIFDLDGVIVSTDNLHFKAWSYLASKEKIYFDKEINNRLRGVSRMDSLEIILSNASKTYTDEEKKALAKIKNDYYVDSLDTLSSKDILPNVLEVLEALKKKNILIAIGSSSRNAKKILEKLGLLDKFDFISDGTNITRSKPYPDVFSYVSDKLGLDPKQCMVVEDAKSGIEAAKAADMIGCAISDAKSSPLADIRLDDILNILNYI